MSPKEMAGQEQLVEFQHLCDQMMFWINYKVKQQLHLFAIYLVKLTQCLSLGDRAQEVIVWPEDLKSEKDSQLIMKQKYAKFNEEVAAQESHVNDVMKLADLLIESKHPDEIVIRRRREVNIDVGSRES
jgi:uncharacterized protein involved in tolerance to divalent cations